MALRPIGHLIKADAHGILPRIGRPPHSSWNRLLDDLTNQFEALIPDQEISIAIRGSVAQGVSVDEAADVDLVIVCDDPAGLSADIHSNVMPELEVETYEIASNAFRTDPELTWMRFVLAHNGCTILGPDKLADLPDPVLGPHCYGHLRDAEKWLEDWKTYWDQDKDYAAICEWLMKRIVRSLFESQIMTINAFTRDIYPCAKVALEAFPNRRNAILKAAELAVAPVADRDVVSGIVEDLSGTLYDEQARLRLRQTK